MTKSKVKIIEVSAALLIAIGFGIYSVYLGQDTNWDLRNYHLYNAYSYVNDRLRFDLAPAGLMTYFNPLLDVLYYKLQLNASPKKVGFIIGFVQGITFLVIYKISDLMMNQEDKIYSFAFAVFGVLSTGFLSEIGRVLYDSLLAPVVLASMYLTMKSIYNKDDNGVIDWNILFAGVMTGIAAGFKLIFLIYAIALTCACFVSNKSITKSITRTTTVVAGIMVGLAVIEVNWAYRIWNEFGSPLFPMYNNVFKAKYVAFEAMRDQRFLPRDIYQYLFYPFYFTFKPTLVSEIQFRQINWIVISVTIPFYFVKQIFRKYKENFFVPESANADKYTRFIITYVGISYLIWLTSFGIYRYLIPIEVMIPTFTFLIVKYIRKTSMAKFIVVATFGGCSVYNMGGIPEWGRSVWGPELMSVKLDVPMDQSQIGALYLYGMPMAWLVPALDISAPFIQVKPSMPVTQDYWEKAKQINDARGGRNFAIFDRSVGIDLSSEIDVTFMKLDMKVNLDRCTDFSAYLARAEYKYKMCQLDDI